MGRCAVRDRGWRRDVRRWRRHRRHRLGRRPGRRAERRNRLAVQRIALRRRWGKRSRRKRRLEGRDRRRTGRCAGGRSERNGPGRQWSSLHRRVDVVLQSRTVVDRDALGYQAGVDRIRTQSMLAHRQRHERLVAVTDRDRRCAFARLPDARIIASSTNGDRRILRQFAVDPVRGVDVGQVVGRAPR